MVPGIGDPQDNLNVAICMGNEEAVAAALKKGANVNLACEYTGWMPIHTAVSNGNSTIIKMLLENKADIKSTNKRGIQPIHLAAKEGDVGLLQQLLKQKADLEAKTNQKKRPIHYACEVGHADVVACLIDAGCDPLTPDLTNASPYDYALLVMETGNDANVKMLQRINCAKTGGAVQQFTPGAVPVTGIVTQVGEDVNKPGTWWWDPEKKMATEEPRPTGHVHPNLPPQP